MLCVRQTLTELFLSPNGKDPLKDLDSKVKAAFTREYNKTVHMSQGLAHSEAFKVRAMEVVVPLKLRFHGNGHGSEV